MRIEVVTLSVSNLPPSGVELCPAARMSLGQSTSYEMAGIARRHCKRDDFASLSNAAQINQPLWRESLGYPLNVRETVAGHDRSISLRFSAEPLSNSLLDAEYKIAQDSSSFSAWETAFIGTQQTPKKEMDR